MGNIVIPLEKSMDGGRTKKKEKKEQRSKGAEIQKQNTKSTMMRTLIRLVENTMAWAGPRGGHK